MLNFLDKYSENGFFYFFPDNDPFRCCNAPTNKSGVYLIYAVIGKAKKLVYIGSSGKLLSDGRISVRKGIGGIRDRLIKGRYSYSKEGKTIKVNRSKFWIEVMIAEKIEKLKIYWFVTHSSKYTDCPLKKDSELRKIHLKLYGKLPQWNRV